MSRTFSRKKMIALVGAATLATVWGLTFAASNQACAELVRHSTPGDLFYNEHVPPGGCGTTGAQLYPCPRPTPAMVGHTYITYQPLMPQEFLYKHHRRYVTKHEDAPPTRTSVHWR